MITEAEWFTVGVIGSLTFEFKPSRHLRESVQSPGLPGWPGLPGLALLPVQDMIEVDPAHGIFHLPH